MSAPLPIVSAMTDAPVGLLLLLLLTLVLMLCGSFRTVPPSRSRSTPVSSAPGVLGLEWPGRALLWLAAGFGTGRIPLMPGTFGSIVGVVWTLALVATQSLWAYGLGLCLGVSCSVCVCTAAERLLGRTDPGSVVLDEIVAMPLGFGGWIGYGLWRQGEMPPVEALISGHGWWLLAVGFLGFRLFDILKPWPVHSSQSLPGGWGVTVDDVLAALYTNLVWVPCLWLGWL